MQTWCQWFAINNYLFFYGRQTKSKWFGEHLHKQNEIEKIANWWSFVYFLMHLVNVFIYDYFCLLKQENKKKEVFFIEIAVWPLGVLVGLYGELLVLFIYCCRSIFGAVHYQTYLVRLLSWEWEFWEFFPGK